jgi:Glycoside hydrolase family 44
MKKALVTVFLIFSFFLFISGCGGGQAAPPPPPANTVTAVTVSPGTASLSPGESKQFTATVTGTGTYSTAVNWSVNNIAGGNATVGTINSSGLYVAPNPVPNSVTIKATSTFDTSKSGSATVTFNTVTGVTVTPGMASVSPGDSKQFTATVTGTGTYSTAVNWSVNDIAGGNATVGTISGTGLYVAPNPAPASVTIKATSTFDATKSGSATITFNAVTGVTVTPATASVSPGASKQFSATVAGTGTYSTDVTWSVNNIAGGNATVGTISSSGLYVAPSSVPASVTVRATSTVDTTKSGAATVTFNTVTSVTVTPATASLSPGGSKQFSATVAGTGNYSNAVTWSVNDIVGGNTTVGTITAAGLYVAPSSSLPASVTIKATSTFDTTKWGSATVNFSAVNTVTVTPGTVTLAPGDTKQFAAAVAGVGTYTTGVTWTVNNIAAGNATVGTISSSGFYVTPYPAPASVTIKATSTFDTTKSGSATVTLSAPTVTAGPALLVDPGAPTHSINPLIYGMNFYSQDPTVAKQVNLPVDRWGGNATTRYNYKLDITNIDNDWFFEVLPNSNSAYPRVSDFNSQVDADRAAGAKTIGTVPVIGWIAGPNRNRACSFSVAKYGPQQKTDQWFPDCGNGIKTDGTTKVVNDPNDTCMPVDESWAGHWVSDLVGWFGNAANGGVAIYSLDNEPTWWDTNHWDVHPLPFTYDEVTQNGLKVAKAVKAADPTAEVSGPVIDFWPAYFYSMKDIRSGWSSGPNWVYNGNPVDRLAHGNVPLLEYYLQYFKAAQDADPSNTRFLDYLDLHTYFAADNAGLSSVGATDQQQAAIDSTRAFWDPTYTSSSFPDPDDTSRTPKAAAPQIIRRMQQWIAADYPGTKTAITEYNWGAQEHISGAVAQADILGIFGREGLDLGTLWGPPDPTTQKPGLLAFEIFRNYDGANGEFGDTSVSATSADQGKLSIYAALRSSDDVLTVVVINKTYGDLTSDLPLANFVAAGSAKVYQYSNADLTAIKPLADITVPPPPSGSTTSTIKNATFPAMSITLIAVPQG